ncbi:MAG: FkbM family methyltransferase [Leptolyngbya sp. SIOISBB]|nr:FkbM family methyltransferase [Leptolyngbya sp. SIOISBB]
MIPTGIILPILVGPLSGNKWIAGAAAGKGKGLSILFNLAEPKQMSIAMELLKPQDICFDIGANVGLYTLLFSQFSKHIFAFEPLPRNISFLVRTVKLNKLRNVTVITQAVSNQDGLSLFEVNENCAIGKLDSSGSQPVSTIQLDTFVESYNHTPSLIKIDVEGGELAVLKGGENTIQQYKPIILLSTHGESIKSECINFLETVNYRCRPINADDVLHATEFICEFSE